MDTGPIPLDANIVLVYGPNATGKTGLMSAIECALIGGVTHLQKFEDDYPRCLRNTECQGNAEVWLEYLDDDGKTHLHHIAVEPKPNGDRVVALEPLLSNRDSLLFTDRCYLSQHRLTRLLEIYQASSTGTEQHLVRFARELLGLDALENLINGLYVVKDERRLKNAVSLFESLHNQAATLTERLRTLNANVRSKDQEWQAAIAALDELDPKAPTDQWTVEQLQESTRILTGELEKVQSSERRTVLQQYHGQMENAVGFLTAISPPDGETSDQLQERLQEILKQAAEIRLRLSAKLVSVNGQLEKLGWSSSDATNTSDFDRHFRILRSEVRRLTSVFDDEVAQRKSAALTLKNSKDDLAAADVKLKSLSDAVGDAAAVSRIRVQLLQAAILCAEGNTCPVCSRDYAEVGAGELGDHLRDELAKLGVTIAQIESQTAERARLGTVR